MNHISITTHVHYQLSSERLRQQALFRGQAVTNDTGALVIQTGKFTGRSPANKFIVSDEEFSSVIDWNNFNQALSPTHFFRLLDDMTAYLDRQPEVWMRDVQACANPSYRLSVRVVTEDPQSNHFAANMLMDDSLPENRINRWQLLHAPGFHAHPQTHGTRGTNFTIISFKYRTVLIGGSAYTGEIKKAIFTILNLLLPLNHKVLSMHCSASDGKEGVALFFGLSGTGKTTLSADPARQLIGDDEHGWDDNGIFNLEGGCYAKAYQLSAEREPAIYNAIREGAIIENTVFSPGTSTIDFANSSITENTRVSYPLHFIEGARQPAIGTHPKNIFLLTCDAYGILPPISRLTEEQAVAYFLSGYTARVSGTENGVLEPKAVFSPCFSGPFLPLSSTIYAGMFAERLNTHHPKVWLVNTGWTGGSYGTGKRIDLVHTRCMVQAALSGALDQVPYEHLQPFNLSIPSSCPGVPSTLLNPRLSWKNPAEYDATAIQLAEKFETMLTL